jgi:hypothetical protein
MDIKDIKLSLHLQMAMTYIRHFFPLQGIPKYSKNGIFGTKMCHLATPVVAASSSLIQCVQPVNEEPEDQSGSTCSRLKCGNPYQSQMIPVCTQSLRSVPMYVPAHAGCTTNSRTNSNDGCRHHKKVFARKITRTDVTILEMF